MAQKNLTPWEKVGEPIPVGQMTPEQIQEATRWGKYLLLQRYRNPKNGELEDYALVGQKDWFVTLVVTKDGRVVTVFEFKQGRDDWGLELPAGTFKGGENGPTAEMVAANVFHETGHRGLIIPLSYTWLATRGSRTRVWHFLMWDAEKVGEARLDAAENIICQMMNLNDWLAAVISGEITEHSAIVTTMRALPYLGLGIFPVKDGDTAALQRMVEDAADDPDAD